MEKNSIDLNKYIKIAENVSKGVDPKFWLEIDGNRYLYKYYEEEKFSDSCRRGQMRTICEVFVSALCKKLGIDCVEASFGSATVDQHFTFGGKKTSIVKLETKGCLIKSYLTDDIVESIPLVDITTFMQRQKNANLLVTDPKSTYETAKFFCEQKGYVLDDDIYPKLKAIALFDYVSGQTDRHDSNIEFLVYKKDGNKHVKLAPLFDNGRCFGYRRFPGYDLPAPSIIHFQMKKYFDKVERDELLSYGNGIACELIKDKELRNLFEKMKKLNINAELKEFAEIYDVEIPKDVAKFISYTWKDGVKAINDALVEISSQNVREHIEYEAEKRRRSDYVRESGMMKYDNFYLLYRCAKQNGGKNSFYDYFAQNREYRKKVDDWEDMVVDEMPKLQDYPLLCQQFSERQKEVIKDLIEDERSQRWREIKCYERRIGKTEKECAIYDLLYKKQSMWVDYGDDWGRRPTMEDAINDYNKQKDKNSDGGRV
ncbi:MAG: hypothetical protein ACI4T2_02025 [Christensenellales bacterium]